VRRTRAGSLILGLASILAACNGLLGNDAVVQWNPDSGTGDRPSDGSSSGGSFVEGTTAEYSCESAGEDASGGDDSPTPGDLDSSVRDATIDATSRDATSDGDATSGDGAGTCPSGQTECSGACVNEQTDHDNCGSCGHACPPGLKCQSGACPTISLVSHTHAAGAAASIATPSISTTGATLIVAACGWYTIGGNAVSCAITDSKTNTWQALGPYQETNASIQASYVIGPSTSATHTFTAATSPSCSGCYADIWILAFGGVSASSISFQTSCGNTAGASPLSSCSAFLTPVQASELLVAFLDTNDAHSSLTYSIDSGFTVVDTIAMPSNTTEGGGDAYDPLGPASPLDPVWTVTGTESDFATTVAAFVY
jgi:hypothetical protein